MNRTGVFFHARENEKNGALKLQTQRDKIEAAIVDFSIA